MQIDWMKLQLKYSNQLCINSKKHTQTVKMWTKKKWKYQITNRNLNNNKHEQKCEQSAKFNWIWKFFKENPNAEMLPHTIKKNMLKTNCNRIEWIKDSTERRRRKKTRLVYVEWDGDRFRWRDRSNVKQTKIIKHTHKSLMKENI